MGEYKKQSAILQKNRKTKMDGLLTVDQKNKIAEGKKKAKDNAQVRGAAKLERAKIKLGLNDEQVAKMKTQQEYFRNKTIAIKENESLSIDEKKEKMKALALERKI